MRRAKVPLEQSQALCGHDSIATTEIYVKAHCVEPDRSKLTGHFHAPTNTKNLSKMAHTPSTGAALPGAKSAIILDTGASKV
jgi:hypothetical protein